MATGKKFSNTFVWIILALLIVGLAGFGATNLSGTVRTVGHVGDQVISVDDYARELQREIRAVEAQTGSPLLMDQVQQMGLDRAVLARLVALASLDNEVAELGISIGDRNLQSEIVSISGFHNASGEFDQETYRFALNQAGIGEVEFENDIRAETARTLVQGAIMAGVTMPPVMADTLVDYVAARRSFTWARLDGSTLDADVPAPSDADLQAYYDARPDQFTLPETKRLTYVLLTPEMMLDKVEVDDSAVRQLYDDRHDEYHTPERRLVERLVFADNTKAGDAMAQLEVGGTTFERLVQDRGLSLADIDLGDVSEADLGAVAAEIFAAGAGEVVGPLPTDLGPALFRINGTLAARTTNFENVEAELRDELAGDKARRLIEAQAQDIDDLLAGGATLQELTAEAGMTLGTIDWTRDASDGVAAYDAFRQAAEAVTDADFPSIGYLEDGGVFALRLDEVLAPRPEPIADARDRLIEGWTAEQITQGLQTHAEGLVATLATSGSFEEAGLTATTETALTRTAYLDGTPADFMNQVFGMDSGDLQVIASDGIVLVVRLDEVLPPQDNADVTAMRDAINEELSQSLSQALFEVFARDAQLRGSPQIDQRALNAVQASFR